MKPVWIGIIALGILPAVLLLALGPGTNPVSHVLGQIAGLSGMTFFAMTFVLSTRAEWVERLFGGLDKVFVAHGVLGATSLLLILAHPLLLVVKFLPDQARLAAQYLLPGGLLSVDLGMYALIGMILLTVLTLYASMRYHRWKISHRFFGLVFLLAAAHVILIRDSGANDLIFPGYNLYAVTVSIIGIGAFIYSLVLRGLLKTKRYTITDIIKHKGSYEVMMEPIAKPLRLTAGQFVFVSFHNVRTGKESHPFSIASIHGGGFTVIMKTLGDFTSRLDGLNIGDTVTVEGPYGRFHPGHFHDEVWIAGGIGITPFLSLSQAFADQRSGSVDLYYVVRNEDDFVHLEQLQRLARADHRFRVYPWVSKKQGRLSVDAIMKRSAPIVKKRYYLCGPESLKRTMAEGLTARGAAYINDERFAFK